ncbi:MAG: TolB family protein, partial [Gemmatimonadales bacterium]
RIVLCRVHDGALITVTDSLSLNTSPAWSPRGDWLYFISDRDGPRDIYAIPIASHGETNGRPIRLSAGLGAHNISLSGTGNSVAYSLYTTRSSIWSIPVPVHPPATSAAATRVTGANEYIERFDVSRDGKWLYYDTDLSGNVDIFRIPTNGGEAEQLTTDPADDFAPSVSPDGMAFAFHSWRSGSRDIFVQRLDGTGVEQVTHSPRQEALPSWAPGGEALAFTELTAKGGVWIVRRDAAGHWGTPAQRLTGGARPQWSPDGRSIAFLASSRGGSIEIVPVDTDPVRTVVDATHPGIPFPEDMVWATDDLIFFASHDPRGNSLIWSVSTNGGSPMLQLRLDPVLHPSYRSTFVVRNGRIYFSTEDRQSDIWMMDVRKPQ